MAIVALACAAPLCYLRGTQAGEPPARASAVTAWNGECHAAWIAEYRATETEAQVLALQQLLRERTESAAALVESDREFAALKARHDEIIARVRAGKSLSDAGLRSLLAGAADIEEQAIQRLARDYRLAVYAAFEHERHQYDMRMEGWHRVRAAWILAGRDPREHVQLIDWLIEASRRIEAGQFARLPARPQFGRAVAPAVVTAPSNPLDPEAIVAEAHAAIAPTALPTDNRLGNSLSSPAKVSPTAPSVAKPIARRRFEPPFLEPKQLADTEPLLADQLPVAPRPTVPAIAPAIRPAPIAQRGAGQGSCGAGQGPCSAPCPSRCAPRHRGHSYRARAPVLTVDTVQRAAADPDDEPTIDRSELRDRISGYRLSLSTLNGHLHDAGTTHAARLTPLVDELEELIVRRGDLMLYLKVIAGRDTLPEKLDSPRAALSLLSAKISATRRHLEDQHDAALTARQHADLAILDQLSQRIASLAARLQQQD